MKKQTGLVGLLRLAVFLPLLCPPGFFKCGTLCRVVPPVVAAPDAASTCCGAPGAMPDMAGTACSDHAGTTSRGMRAGCCCPTDAQAIAGSPPRRMSEASGPCAAATGVIIPELHSASVTSFVDAALTGYSPPDPGSPNTYLLIASLRI